MYRWARNSRPNATFIHSPVKFPRLIECALPMTACDNPEEHYRFGVDLFIGGLAAVAAARAGAAESASA
jgi:hypothetical protein